MTFALIRYDAARKALAAAHRVDEVKRIHNKAAALLAYAQQAGDLTLQNQAAEIRILAERRAGQLLVDMRDWPTASQAAWPSEKSVVANDTSGTRHFPRPVQQVAAVGLAD